MVSLVHAPTQAGRMTANRVAHSIGQLATQALLHEAGLDGKPGLVGPHDSAGHDDMDHTLMVVSAHALYPGFEALAGLGTRRLDDATTRCEAGLLGRRAEGLMLAATGGINTHRGAIWALGLLAVAAGNLAITRPDMVLDADEVCALAGRIAAHPDPASDASRPCLPGARARARHGVGGAVSQATAGFPHARMMLATLRAGQGELGALLTGMAELDDTCLLHRGGADGLELVRHGAARVLRLGPNTPAGQAELDQLARTMRDRRLSPGGSADLLAATLFLDRLTTGHLAHVTLEAPCRH